tara:strand:+ start:4102 stop:5919 length:1818 start_codon:yes stop_codon:yes gene_type:complete
MKNIYLPKVFVVFVFIFSVVLNSQSMNDLDGVDMKFIESLPDQVREDVMKEMQSSVEDEKNQFQGRPSTKLSKLETIKKWEQFQQKQNLESRSERYGIRIFNSMQSSFMPLNEPNFGNNYIVDYGDVFSLQLYGATSGIRSNSYFVEVQRDGTLALEDIGRVMVAGLNFEQAVEVIQSKYETSFIGLNVAVTLSEIRDINVLVTGNVEFPGIYTLSGNSNILQALNAAGGANENGTLRSVTIKRKNKSDLQVDLYKALIFGDIDNIPFLMSGDSIHVEPVKNLVRAGYGFNNTAVFEMLENETIEDLVSYAGGLKIEANNTSLKLVRFEDNAFNTYDINFELFSDYDVKNLDSIYAYKEEIGVITISGNVKHPGKYSISSSDRLLDIIKRSGGYTKSAYPFAASLYRKSSQELETMFVERAYKNLITFIATNPNSLGSGASSGEALGYVLSEIRSHKPLGRVIAEFDIDNLESNIQNNIYLNNNDNIHIPSYDSNVYVFGEVGNPGSVLFTENISIDDYIEKSGGLTRYSSTDSIFIVSPNGETKKVYVNGFKKFVAQDFDIFPGSVIYVPRHIGKVEGINFYATVAPIFSSLALSIASLNSISN